MMTTKRRFGKLGGNVAYHGYQSFQAGEVTPEEAHRIGIETAKRMWGDDYEIVVTTHLNTAKGVMNDDQYINQQITRIQRPPVSGARQ